MLEFCLMLSLIDALAITEVKERPFQLKFVAFDKTKKTGGNVVELTNAYRVGAKYNHADNDMITVKQKNNSNHPYPVHTHMILEVNGQEVYI